MKLHNLYLVDYENVHQHGLNGISELTEQDHLVIFWGAKCGALKGDTYMQIISSKAKLDFKTSTTVASQYIDTWIDSYLGYLLGINSYDEVFIISNDKGFQSMIDLWSDHKISRRKSIAYA